MARIFPISLKGGFGNCFAAVATHLKNVCSRRDPSQNSAAARKEMKKLGVEVHSIPPRSPDINPIENVFHLLDRKLRSEAVEQNITNESYKEFSARVKSTIENIPVEQIDKIIDTIPKRMRDIISVRGERIKY